MSGQSFTWIIAEDFKNTITPAQLTLQAADPQASREMEFISGRGLPAAAFSRRIQKSWDIARQLKSGGLALRRPIAMAVQKNFCYIRVAYLALEIIPGALPLKNYIDLYGTRPAGMQLQENRDLIDVFTDFASRLRRVCLLPADFNLADVLIKIEDGGAPKLYLADAGRLELKRSTTGRARMDSLLMLDAVLWGKAPSRQQLLFARMYQRSFTRWCRTTGLRCIDVVKELRFFSSCFSDRQFTRCFRTGDLQGCLQRGRYENALVKLLENPDSLFSRSDAVILKNSPTTTALLLQTPELPFPLYLKRYNPKGRLFGLKYLLRRSRAERVWRLARQMDGLQIPAPEVLGFVEQRRFGLLQAAYLISRGLAGAESLDAHVEKHFPLWNMQTKNLFIQQVAALLSAVHSQGLVHGDMKAKNILVTTDGENEKLWLIDLDTARLRKSAMLTECCRDLARLNCSFLNTSRISRPQRLRFLKTYVQNNQPGLREVWQAILKLSNRKLKKSGRSFSR